MVSHGSAKPSACLVDFVIAGAQKAASSTLYQLLRQHPALKMPEKKELQFFTRKEFYQQGEEFLSVFRRDVPEGGQFGLADVQIMYFPEAAARLASNNSALRALVTVRNPIDRAYSAFWFARLLEVEQAETFEEGLAREDERAGGSYSDQATFTYLRHGHYAEQIERLQRALGWDQVMVFRYEDIVGDPAGCARRAFEWLGVSPDMSIQANLHVNPSSRSRSRMVQRFMLSSQLRVFLSRVVPTSTKYWLRRHVLTRLIALNRRPVRNPPMRPDTRARLVEYYRPLNARLSDLLGIDLSAWNR